MSYVGGYSAGFVHHVLCWSAQHPVMFKRYEWGAYGEHVYHICRLNGSGDGNKP